MIRATLFRQAMFAEFEKDVHDKIENNVMLSADETGLPKDSIALCENPVSFPKDKLEKYVTTISDENLKKIAIANTLASSAISFLNMNELISL